MTRKLAAAFLLSFILIFVAAPPAPGADKPIKPIPNRAAIPARLAPVYGFGGDENLSLATSGKASLAPFSTAATNAVGLQIGITSYDYQHNCSMGRQVEHRNTNFLHFDWMKQTSFEYPGDRVVAYQAYNLITCNKEYSSGEQVNSGYGGYVCIDVDEYSRAIPAAHAGTDYQDMASRTWFDFGPAEALFTYNDFPTDKFGWYQNAGIGPANQNLWPKIDWQIGTETVLHMVCAESGGSGGDPQTISYYRRVGPYRDESAQWSAQRLIDTVMNINVVVAASPINDKIAIAWNAPVDYRRDQGVDVEYDNQYENDVWYAVSTDQGADWIANIGNGSIGHGVDDGQHNITRYDSLSPWKAYCDMSALISTDNNLHIVWGCRRWEGSSVLFRRQSAIFHWSEDMPVIRPVVKAEWDTGGYCFGHSWGSDAAKMSISECDGKLYVLYTQFGNANAPCYDVDAENNVVNGELYLTVSNNHGLNWDRPQNLTNTVTDSCISGNCESDYWASMARYGRIDESGCQEITPGRPVLDIIYINDRSAGGAIQVESGVWTTNPVMWFPAVCRDIVAEPGYSDDAADAYGECYDEEPLVLEPGRDTVITFTIENDGTLDNNFTISVNYTSGLDWISVQPKSGVVESGLDNSQEVSMNISAPFMAPDPSVWLAEVEVSHDAAGSPRIIPICLMVASEFVRPEASVLATACTRVKVFNTGELVGNTPYAALDFAGDCDTLNQFTNSAIYLSDASPVICRIDGNGDTLRFMSFSREFTGDDALRPLSPLTLDETGNPDYNYASSVFATADTAIGFMAEYYLPVGAGDCSFVIEKLSFFNMTSEAMPDVLVGEILDWDVPSDSGVDNGSGYDISRQLIYHFGAEYNQDDATEAVCPQESDDRFGGIAAGPGMSFKNAMTINNAAYIYQGGPYGDDAPLPPGPTYRLMKESDIFSVYQSQHPDSQYIDISTLVTFGEYNLVPDDTACVVKILAASRDGLLYLTDMIDIAYDFIADHPEIGCAGGGCDVPGDANHDGINDIADMIYIVNFIFRDGPPPVYMAEGDANADGMVNIGDVVYLINYFMKGGPEPVCP
jgi:hypothetical protein